MNSLGYQIAVVIHVLSAVIWVGGVIFIAAVALPGARALPDEEARVAAVSEIATRFRTLGWTLIALLLGSGIYLIAVRGATWTNLLSGQFFSSNWGWYLGVKLIAVAIMLLASGLHDWWVGPKATELLGKGSGEAGKWQRWAGLLGALTGFSVLAIVILAVFVARPWML